MLSFICFLCSAVVCLLVVGSTIWLEKRKDRQQTAERLIAKVVAYIMCAAVITVACWSANLAPSHISSIIYLSMVFVCQCFAGLMKRIFCPNSHWRNFRCYIEGFVIALSVIFLCYQIWSVSIVLWVYVLAFYFNFAFEEAKKQILEFVKSLPCILYSCVIWLGVLGVGYFLDKTIKENAVAVGTPWLLTIGAGLVSLVVIRNRKRVPVD